MKFPTNKIEAAVSPEQSRYTINAVKLDVANKKLVATDGHILAAVPVEVDAEDHSALIGIDAIKSIRDIAKRDKVVPAVNVNGKIEVVGLGTRAEHATVEGSFPDYERVIPHIEGKPTISFDVNLLVRLVDALRSEPGKKNGCKRVSLWIQDESHAIVVKAMRPSDSSTHYEESVGVMLPVRA